MDDTRLDQFARDHRAGDQGALRPLVDALTRSLIAMAYRYVGDWETARDLTQETWLRVHRTIEKWDPTRPVRPWIFSMHRNVCLDHLRRDESRNWTHDLSEDLPASGDDPLSAAAHSELAGRIRRALPDLGEVQRRVLVMVDLEELAPAEVASATGMHPTTVRTTLHFARRKLARLLGEEKP